MPTESLSREETAEFARRLVDFYGPTRNWTIWAVPELDAEGTPLRNHLSEELMYLSGDNIAGSTVPGLDIVEITDRPGMLHFEEIWARSYGHVHLLNADPQDLFNERVLGQGHRLWLGHMAGRPVATAGSFVHSGINVIRTVSTLPEFQGMGIGTAMTLQAVTASDLPRVLNAEPGAEGLYRRLGFVKIADFRFWSIPSLETQTGAT